jgi:CheY-like chemotaxis protein
MTMLSEIKHAKFEYLIKGIEDHLLKLPTRKTKMTTLSKRILFVDDEEILRETIEEMLMKLGYDVELAGDAKEALEFARREHFPLIITDLMMPGMDGTQLCKHIRKINQKAIIYAFSGFLTEVDSDELKDVGFDGHLCKPVKMEVLKQAVEGAFEKIHKRRARDDCASLNS